MKNPFLVNTYCVITNFSPFLFQYEPVFDSSTSVLYLNHMLLYECQGLSDELENLSRQRGQPCFQLQSMHCNTVVANWARGSDVSFFSPFV